ncbi:hypothetical protein T492DRAFT_254801 [Pavlovales sp. CCMP2436]|nr:hypothetical protein T492DRAFT_254801 [Pavlovales sp. CCMP2436]
MFRAKDHRPTRRPARRQARRPACRQARRPARRQARRPARRQAHRPARRPARRPVRHRRCADRARAAHDEGGLRDPAGARARDHHPGAATGTRARAGALRDRRLARAAAGRQRQDGAHRGQAGGCQPVRCQRVPAQARHQGCARWTLLPRRAAGEWPAQTLGVSVARLVAPLLSHCRDHRAAHERFLSSVATETWLQQMILIPFRGAAGVPTLLNINIIRKLPINIVTIISCTHFINIIIKTITIELMRILIIIPKRLLILCPHH